MSAFLPMNPSEDALEGLFEAIEISPDNVPLRKHVAEMLMDLERYEEAEKQYYEALELAPTDVELKIGLAEACMEQGKISMSMVVLEEVLGQEKPPADAYYLHALVSARQGDFEQAQESYRIAVQIDPELEDEELEAEISMRAEGLLQGLADLRQQIQIDDDDEELPASLIRPSLRFSDVNGLEDQKAWLKFEADRNFSSDPLIPHRETTHPTTVLLSGPEAVGKRRLAQALAGEVDAYYLEVSPAFVARWMEDHSDFADAWDKPGKWERRPLLLVLDRIDSWSGEDLFRVRPEARLYLERFWHELAMLRSLFTETMVILTAAEPWRLDMDWLARIGCRRGIYIPGPEADIRIHWLKASVASLTGTDTLPEQLRALTAGFTYDDLVQWVDVARSLLARKQKGDIAVKLTEEELIAVFERFSAYGKVWHERLLASAKPELRLAYMELGTTLTA